MRVLALAALTFVWLSAGCLGADKGAATAANADIIEGLPVFPGAQEVDRQVFSYTLSDSGPPDGYTTLITYAVDEAVTADEVVAFYMESMDGWTTPGPESIPCIDNRGNKSDCDIRVARFLRGDAAVSVGTDNLTSAASTFEVGVEATRCAKDKSSFCDPP